MNLHKTLNELLEAKVISEETASNIRHYYQQKEPESSNRLFVVFGILGAILVGLGIILILAHNWDNLSRTTKSVFAFLPLIIGQGFCGFTLLKKSESIAWRESSAAFLTFAVGSSIALVSQIYNIPGDFTSFLLTWLLLCLPLVYIMKSSIVSLLYLAGIAWYTTRTGYDTNDKPWEYLYFCLLLFAILPHYYLLYKHKPYSNFMNLHNWMIPLSIIITLGTVTTKDGGQLMFVAYISLFGLLYLIGNSTFFKNQSLFKNGYRVQGAIGTIVLLLFLSFNEIWRDLIMDEIELINILYSPDFFVALIVSLLATILLVRQFNKESFWDFQPVAPVFLLFIVIFIIGMFAPFAAILINLLLFAIGVWTVRKGAIENHLGILNYGLFIITALVLCRFFDTDLSFVWRGILFVAVGIGFFFTNYWMLKKRRSSNQKTQINEL